MCKERLRKRLSTFRFHHSARLPGHQLRFHKAGIDGSAKADAYQTGNPHDAIWGVLCSIDPQQKKILDDFEGLGEGYGQKVVDLLDEAGNILTAITYYALPIDPDLKPYTWYRNLVLVGAIQHKLPHAHIESIRRTAHLPDPDLDRANTHESLIRGWEFD